MRKKIFSFIKEHKVFLLIFVLFLLIRLLNDSTSLWYETSVFIRQIAEFITIKGQIFTFSPHFPLAVIIYKIGSLFVQDTLLGVRLTHLLLNIITFFVVYRVAFFLYNDKKIANRSIFIYTIWFYAFASHSLGIDQDLGLNPLLFLLTLYFYKKSTNLSLSNIIKVILPGVFLSVSRPILGIIVFFIIFLDMCVSILSLYGARIRIKHILHLILDFMKLFLPYLVLASIFGMVMYFLFPDPVIKSIANYKILFSHTTSSGLLTKISFAGQVFIYTTPLLLLILLLLKNFLRHQIIVISSFVMFFYTSMGLSGGDPARWMSAGLPIFAIGIGYICFKYSTKRVLISSLAMAILLIILNSTISYQSLPLSLSDYLSHPLDRLFILTTTIFSPIYLQPKLLFGVLGISVFTFLLAVLFRRASLFLSCFLTISLGFNIFMIATYTFQIKQPHISNITKQMYEFCNENCRLGGNIYVDHISRGTAVFGIENREIASYFAAILPEEIAEKDDNITRHSYVLDDVNLFTEGNSASISFMDTIREHGSGFVFLLYYYGKSNDIATKTLDTYCRLQKEFFQIKQIKGLVYYCDI